MALKGFDLDGTRILAVDDPEIVAAMKAINYIWDAVPDSPHKTAIVVKSLDDLFRELAPLATDPPLMTLPLGR